ncbi:CSLREA domain-containing protein [Acinetobacter sp. C26M]|uniref:CSLREA domain-containing protein n=1 Tax=unclassified Acinetobacter TaxID=196816 RepID=UPI002037259F|nr:MULTISPECIES: CSLREA domain-containing protein [unclassified Acinetobacter]USA47659.1 CSLREA domain-containing protein [Acinetobacter sp. C26M]USA51140.1 CSLREA domain-containing protein [Acinetobacter sp. C26G]
MKNYKKTLLATMVLATMPLMAAGTSGTPIKVTTFADEDNENMNACSLREALITAETRKSYGGCSVTDTLSTSKKVIQLEAGVYTLKKELTPNVDVAILGASPLDWQEKSVLTNDVVMQYPAQTALKTTIKAENSRIFNTTFGAKELSLNSLILSGGNTADRGGAIYAGANLLLQNTQILNSKAKEGGAIFLAGPSASLTLTNSLIQGNQAEIGSVLSMSCKNDLSYSKREINITANSFIGNGADSSRSMLEFCGEPNVTMSANTIAKNSANIAFGNLIKFSGDTRAGTEPNIDSSVLSKLSSLTLTSNTIVENQSFTTVLYDKLGTKKLYFNVLAYNGDNNTYACRYLLGAAEKQEKVNLTIQNNAISRTGSNKCDLPEESLKDNTTNIDVGGVSFGTLLGPLQTPSAYTVFLPIYYPKNNHTKTDLVDIDKPGCTPTDQRGLARITEGTLFFDPDARNSCDIGAIELMKFTAGDIQDLRNTSLKKLISEYQAQYDFYDDLVKNPNDPDLVTYYKSRVAQYKRLLEGTKANFKYRAIYLDLSTIPLPEEIEQADGSHKLKFFNQDDYNIKVEALGTGLISDSVMHIQPDEGLVCNWNSNLQQVIIYRKDDKITQAGDQSFCKYTLTSKLDSNVTSSGLLSATFVNIAPVATDTSITFKYREKQRLSLNLLSFANDAGDTGEGGSGPEKNPNKPQFWKNKDGVELPIRLTNVPRDLTISADRQGACPEPNEKETCYGGNIYVQELNAFNPFNFDFKYQVYDADAESSNVATVRTINTATTTDDTRPAGGGGSLGFYSIFGLLGLLAYRRFKK